MSASWRIRSLLARSGLNLLKLSGCYGDYFTHWRGAIFDCGQRMGLHVVPVHYYSPIPDSRVIPPDTWTEPIYPSGLPTSTDSALRMMLDLAERYREQLEALPEKRTSDPHQYFLRNPAFSGWDSAILYGLVRQHRPRRIVEIGSGYSTLLVSQALRDEGIVGSCRYVCIEPYPPECLRPPPREVSELIATDLQSAPMSLFEDLDAGDILFIDSSHVAKVASDVVYEYLRIIPSLRPGVVVHVHDIFLPYEYPRKWIEANRFFWNEQYLMGALLTSNCALNVEIPVHAVYRAHRPELDRCMPLFGACDAPASFWMKTV